MTRPTDVDHPKSKKRETELADYSMRLKIGVMGSASIDQPADVKRRARQLGRAIAQSGCITITGGCPGLPLEAAIGAKECGGTVIGISPALSLDEHAYHYQSPTVGHDVLIFTGSGLMGREVVNIRSSDMVVIVGGSSGTLGELAIAYDEGKLIGVLTQTGGISDMVSDILRACKKETGARVIYEPAPQRLIQLLVQVYTSEHFRRPSVFCRKRMDDREPETSNVASWPKDPVCGMPVQPGRAAARRRINDHTFVFCSLECAAKFDLSPESYCSQQG